MVTGGCEGWVNVQGNCQAMPVLGRCPRVAVRVNEDRPIRSHVAARASSTSHKPVSLSWYGTRAVVVLVCCMFNHRKQLTVNTGTGEATEKSKCNPIAVCVPLMPWPSCANVQQSTHHSWGTHLYLALFPLIAGKGAYLPPHRQG